MLAKRTILSIWRDHRKEVFTLKKTGMSNIDIAEKLGVSASSVGTVLWRYGEKTIKPKRRVKIRQAKKSKNK